MINAELSKPRIFLFLIVLLAVFLRFYKLHDLPADTFGDMVENIEHVQAVLNGDWKLIYGFDGREALFFYVSALSSFILGNTYYNLKFVTALVGIATVVSTYALVKLSTNTRTALIAAFLVAVSKWPLVYSRMGFRTVFTPLFASLVFFFFLRAVKYKKLKDIVLCSAFLGIGLYSYTAFKFVIMSVILMGCVLLVKRKRPSWRSVKHVVLGGIVFGLVAMPQVIDVLRFPDLYLSHPGPMIMVDGKVPNDWWKKLATNIVHQAGMLHVKGDIVFRINPRSEPQLDVLSGLFFIAGLVGIGIWYRNKTFFLLSIPFFVLQLPSVLVLNFPQDVPSATRTTSIIPLVFLITAVGIDKVCFLLRKSVLQYTFLAVALSIITVLNFQAYFERYAMGLPNKNVAYDRVIASYIDVMPAETIVYLVGGSWADAGQPHPRAILYSMETKREVKKIDQNIEQGVCELLEIPQGSDFFIIINPNLVKLPTESCFKDTYQRPIMTKYGQTVFIAVSTKPIPELDYDK